MKAEVNKASTAIMLVCPAFRSIFISSFSLVLGEEISPQETRVEYLRQWWVGRLPRCR